MVIKKEAAGGFCDWCKSPFIRTYLKDFHIDDSVVCCEEMSCNFRRDGLKELRVKSDRVANETTPLQVAIKMGHL